MMEGGLDRNTSAIVWIRCEIGTLQSFVDEPWVKYIFSLITGPSPSKSRQMQTAGAICESGRLIQYADPLRRLHAGKRERHSLSWQYCPSIAQTRHFGAFVRFWLFRPARP